MRATSLALLVLGGAVSLIAQPFNSGTASRLSAPPLPVEQENGRHRC
jgi:hypothetical protein